MSKKYCRPCGTNTQHKPYRTGLFKFDGERVKTCKKCGHLRTQNQIQINEAEMIHIPTQTKKKNMEDN
jgi:hypothetical protein